MTDIRRIDLNLLVVLDTLLDERNVSRAATRLSLTQPTVSGMLHRLRAMFDDPLFVRAQRGILPTPRAQALAEPLKQWPADADALVRPATFNPKMTELTFTISVNDYLQYALIVPLVGVLRREAPNIRLAVKPVIADLSVALMRGDIDLAVTIPDVVPPEAHSCVLYNERYIGVVRSEHPLAGVAVSLEDFCRFDHVLVSPTGGAFEGPTDQALSAIGRQRPVHLSVPNFLVLPDILLTNDIIAVVPERLLRAQDGKLRAFEPPVDIPGFDLVAVWHPRVDDEPAHNWIRERIRAVAREFSATGMDRLQQPTS